MILVLGLYLPALLSFFTSNKRQEVEYIPWADAIPVVLDPLKQA
jgi:hypothetical protein